MAAPFLNHLDVATLVGSWPMVVTPSFAAATVIPNSLENKATILGIRRASLYNVGGLSFRLWLDGAGSPAIITFDAVAVPGFPNFTLTEVIGKINGAAGITPQIVAFNDNGFLRLRSPTTGATSFLRLESIAGAERVFRELGLFSETTSRGGHIRQAQHIDPSRQVAGPGQLSQQWGESFGADVFNRMALQLATNADISNSVTDRKKVPVVQEEQFTGTGAMSYQLNTANPTQEVFVGSVVTPNFDQIKDQIVVLDANGNEFVKMNERLLAGPFSDFEIENVLEAGNPSLFPDMRAVVIESASLPPFYTGISAVETENLYVIFTDLTGANVNYNNVPLKFIGRISSTRWVVMNYNSLNQRVTVTPETGRSARVVELLPLRAEIEGFFSDAGLTTRAEGVQVVRASGSINRIEKNNRIQSNFQTFVTAGVKAGDIFEWTGASSTDPYSNNGNYRVHRVIDEETLELVSDTYGPVILNPNLSGGYGSFTIKTDGEYWPQPYVKFADPSIQFNRDSGRGAIPAVGEVFKLAYQVALPLRQATEGHKVTGSIARGRSLRSQIKSDGDARRVLTHILGPFADKHTDVFETLSKFRQNTLQHLRFVFETEHHPVNDGFGGINALGRHSWIRPDKIDFYQDSNGEFGALQNSGPTFIMRPSSADDAALPALQTAKMKLRNFADTLDLWGVTNEGSTYIGGATQITHGFGPFDPIIGSSKGIFDFFITRGSTRNALLGLRGDQSHLYLYANAASGTTPGIIDGFSSSIRFRYMGPTPSFPTLQPTEWALGANRAVSSVNDNLLKLDLTQNEGAAGLRNIQVWAHDGSVGINFQSQDGLADDFKPQTGLHIRARSNTDEELLRLEGFSQTGHDTVAMSFKPRRNKDLFGFIQVSKDGATNDWSFDFATTTAMDTEVTTPPSGLPGPTGQGFFRWVMRTAAGVGFERARLLNETLDIRTDKTFATSTTLFPSIKVTTPTQGSFFVYQNIFEIGNQTGVSKTKAFLRLLEHGGSNGFGWTYNAAPTDNVASTWTADIGSAAGQSHWMNLETRTSPLGATSQFIGKLFVKTRHVDVPSPFASSAWYQNLKLELPVPSIDVWATRLTLGNGILRFDQTLAHSGGPTSNPPYGSLNVGANELCAKNIIKAWISYDRTGDDPTIPAPGSLAPVESYNATVAYNGFATRVTMQVPLNSTFDYCVLAVLENTGTTSGTYAPLRCKVTKVSTTVFDVNLLNSSGVVMDPDPDFSFHTVSLIVLGLQVT